MIPGSTWGSTPESEKAWHKSNDCDNIMGGRQLLNCPYICSANSGNKIVSEHFFLKPYASLYCQPPLPQSFWYFISNTISIPIKRFGKTNNLFQLFTSRVFNLETK